MVNRTAAYQIIDQTNDFIIVNKLNKRGFHDTDHELGLFNLVKQEQNLSCLYPVHRLDKVTTGLLIMAKSLDAAQYFQRQFEQKSINKLYLALSDKKPKKKQGLIIGDMAKARRGAWKLSRTQSNPAITQFFSYSPIPGKRLFLLNPHTGKTHQLRVALNSLGAPIIGDVLYGGTQDEATYLHAFAISFTLKGAQYEYVSKPTKDFWVANEVAAFIEENFSAPFNIKWPRVSGK